MATDPNTILNHINDQFINSPMKIISNMENDGGYIELNRRIIMNNFRLSEFTETQIVDFVSCNTKPKVSCGFNDITGKIFKKISCHYFPLSYLINWSFQHGCFPDKLKLNAVTLVYRKDNKKDPHN